MGQETSPSSELVPAEEVVKGIRVRHLPDGYTPLEGVMVLKCIDEDGDTCYITRYSPDIHSVEVLGMIQAAKKLLEKEVVSVYIPDEGEEE